MDENGQREALGSYQWDEGGGRLGEVLSAASQPWPEWSKSLSLGFVPINFYPNGDRITHFKDE